MILLNLPRVSSQNFVVVLHSFVSTRQSSWIVKPLSRKNDAKVRKELEEPSQPSCQCADNQTELLMVSHLSFTQTSLSAHMKAILGVVEVAPLLKNKKTITMYVSTGEHSSRNSIIRAWLHIKDTVAPCSDSHGLLSLTLVVAVMHVQTNCSKVHCLVTSFLLKLDPDVCGPSTPHPLVTFCFAA